MRISNNQFNCGVLVVAALLLNIIFLYINYGNKEYVTGVLHPHGEVGFNVYKYNSIKISPERLNAVLNLQEEQASLVNYNQIDHTQFSYPTAYRNIFDTVGYGVLLGLLWKVTNSLHYLDVQILQIIIFSLLMILIYLNALMLWGSSTIAFNCGMAHLLFLPLAFQNVQANRDIWAYYGVLICLYAMLRCIYKNASWKELFFLFSIYSLTQFIRFISFLIPILILCCMSCICFYYKKYYINFFKLASSMVLALVLFCITPLVIYNTMVFHQLWVFPSGVWLIEGLGDYENPWGYKCNDAWVSNFIKNNYNAEMGTLEGDICAKKLFLKNLQENPWIFIKNCMRRLKGFFLPNLPWSFYPESLYSKEASLYEKAKKAFSSFTVFCDLMTRALYIRLYLLLSYIGLFLLFVRRRYFEFFLILGIILSSWGVIVSHIEYRYLVPFYCFSSLSIGYLFSSFPLYSSYFFKQTAKS